MMRPVFGLVALLAAASLLAGCSNIPQAFTAQVPTSGPIEQGEQVSGSSVDQFIRVIARPPREGMTAPEVVQGFLDASASFDGGHAVAREYLTPQASARWDAGSGVTVYEGVPTLTESGPNVQFLANQAGRIDQSGRYQVDDPGSEASASFTVIETEEGLRIDNLPDGLLLSQTDVDRAFRSYALYFFDPTFSILVPDSRMVPVSGPGLATTLVLRLLDGPNEWLQPAVRTGFPDGLGLNIDAVLIDGGVARVDLDASAQLADDAARRALSQQLVWTLRQLPDVQAVDITAAGQQFFVPGVTNPQPRDSWPQVDPSGLPTGASAYVASSIGVRRITEDGIAAVPGQAGSRSVIFDKIAISDDSSRIAGIDGEGQLWSGALVENSTLFPFDSVAAPQSIAFDGDSNVWVVDEDGDLFLYSPSGRAFPIEIDGLRAGDVLRAAVPSRDGTRAAVLVASGPRTNLYLTRVVRPSATGRVGIMVQDPIRVESKLVEAVAVAWSSADTLAVLGSESAGSAQVYEVNIGRGGLLAQGAPESPISLAAAPGLPTLVAGTDGVVYDNTTGTWSGRVNAASPAYPG